MGIVVRDRPQVTLRAGWRVPAGLFATAVGIRLLVLFELSRSPISGIPLVDAETYHTLARHMAAGEPVGASLFWQPPFYPFFLAMLYKLAGPSIQFAQIIQAILGGVTCVLTYALGKRVLGHRGGVIAALLVALSGPLIFIETDLVASGLAALVSLVLVLALLRAEGDQGIGSAAAFGALGAIAMLIRPEFLAVAIGGALWLSISAWRAGSRRLAAANTAATVAGFLMIALPVAWLNLEHGARVFSVFPFSGGLNLYIGNNPNVCETLTARPGWDWTALTILPNRDGPIGPAGYQAFFCNRVLAYAASHPLSFASGMLLKCLRLLNAREIPRNIDPYVVRQWSHLLGALLWKIGRFGFPFGVLLPLAAIGTWRLGKRIPAALWLLLVLYGLSVIGIFVADRYRAPMLPALSIVAAAGVLSLIQIVRERRPRNLLLAGILIAAAVALSTLPAPFCEEKLDYEAELFYLIGLSHHHEAQNTQDERVVAEQARLAEGFYRQAIERDPGLADAWNELGNLRTQEGRYDEAMSCYGAAVTREPNHGKAWHNRGFLFYRAGDYKDAAPCFRRAADLDPTFTRSSYLLGQSLIAQGMYVESIQALERAITRERDPSLRAQEMQALESADAKLESGAH